MRNQPPELRALVNEWDHVLPVEDLLYYHMEGVSDRLVIPAQLRNEYILKCHQGAGNAHDGFQKSYVSIENQSMVAPNASARPQGVTRLSHMPGIQTAAG